MRLAARLVIALLVIGAAVPVTGQGMARVGADGFGWDTVTSASMVGSHDGFGWDTVGVTR